MSTSTMHFGPEWMRTKHQPLARTQPPSPPPTATNPNSAASYSAHVSASSAVPPNKRDETHPFRYSKEELLKIYRESGGRGGLSLGLEVERWEGIVRETPTEPAALRELTEAQKKLFAGPLNSDLRRRQSTDYVSQHSQAVGTERTRLTHSSTSSGGTLRERAGALKLRDVTDVPLHPVPRKTSHSSAPTTSTSPRDPNSSSQRSRVGYSPGFDGILSSGNSWAARRRASEIPLKPGVGSPHTEGNRNGILEVEEEEIPPNAGNDHHISGQRAGGPNSTISKPPNGQGAADLRRVVAASVDAPQEATLSSENPDMAFIGPPPGIVDLASVDWSYKDPTGQIQGPFRADVMQKWFDDGYFSPELPMKRTHIDGRWTTVEELSRRAQGDKIFLSPTIAAPPGLSRRVEAFGTPTDQAAFVSPYQPAPIRTLRSSTLDSFISNGSNASNSPSPSVGGRRCNSNSPDTLILGGYYPGELSVKGQTTSLQGTHGTHNMPSLSGRRATMQEQNSDHSLGLRSPTYNGMATGRITQDASAYTGAYNPSSQGVWNSAVSHTDPAFEVVSAGRDTDMHYHAFVNATSLPQQQCLGRGDGNGFQNGNIHQSNNLAAMEYGGVNDMRKPQLGSMDENAISGFHQFNVYGSLAHPVSGNEQRYNQHSPSQDQVTRSPSASDHVYVQAAQTSPLSPSVHAQTPWSSVSEPPPPRRPGPFDAQHPTVANTIVISPASSPWGSVTQQPTKAQPDGISPWTLTSQPTINETRQDANTTSTHDRQPNVQNQSSKMESTGPMPPAGDTPSPPVHDVSQAPASAKVTAVERLSAQAASQPQTATADEPSTLAAAEGSSQPQGLKTPWQGAMKKPVGASVSLREIQETEMKLEARKTEWKVVRAPETKDDAPAFTTSWGLPTSQVGTRAPASSSSPQSAPAAPVWTNMGNRPRAAKMKEIWEEEQMRKKLGQVAAARRTYADAAPKATSQSGGAWTTVGPGGKSSSPARLPAAPPMPPVAASATSGRTNGTVNPRSTSGQPPLPSSKDEDKTVTPSREFLKWLSESLKGLNSSVNVEEIISMLLSFQMDPDPSTVELISELIYANSTTLDGRRFATEFVSKRKIDASRNRGPAKPISIADVVKSTPKTPESEWGFKVVNKKKKGGRS